MQTLNERLEFFYNTINNYSLIELYKNGKLNRMFIDGITMFGKNFSDIALNRTFASPIVPSYFVTDAKYDDGDIIIHCGKDNYRLRPIQKRQEATVSSLPNKFAIDELVSFKYIDESKVAVRGTRVYLPISVSKLGLLNNKQRTQIRYLLDMVLDGSREVYQCCRVPAFSVEILGSDYVLNGHIYDLGNKVYMNTVKLYDSREDFNKVEPFKEFVLYAKSFMT